MKHGRSNHHTPPRRSKARFEATIALQTPAHQRTDGNSRCPHNGGLGPGSPFKLKGEPANTTAGKCANRQQRERQAANAFTRWRTQHPNATSAELRNHWREIQVDWNLSTAARKPR